MDGGRGKGGMSSLEPFVCAIPLKPTDDPLKEDQVQKMKNLMVDEYAVRYLESIGASATPANIARIRNEIPLQRFKLTAAFKSRGGLDDVFYLQNVEPKNEGRHLWRSRASRSTFSDMVDRRLAPSIKASEQRKLEQEGAEKDKATKKEWAKDNGGYKSALPKLDTKGASQMMMPPDSRAPPLSPSRRDDIASRVAMARMGARKGRSTSISTYEEEHGLETSRSAKSRRGRRAQVSGPGTSSPDEEEEEQTLSLTIEDVLTMQTMFIRTFPLAHIAERMTTEEMSMLVGELMSIPMAELVQGLSAICEWAIVFDGDPPEHHDLCMTEEERLEDLPLSKSVEVLILSIYEGWVDMQSRITRRSMMVLAYPIYLMLIRVCVETVLRNALSWVFSDPAQEMHVLNQIDKVVSFLLDPDGYLNFPPPAPPGKTFSETAAKRLQSEVEGVPAQLNKPWSNPNGKKPNPASKFNTISPMTRNLFQTADSPQLRIMMNRVRQKIPMGGGRMPVGGSAGSAGGGVGRKTSRPGTKTKVKQEASNFSVNKSILTVQGSDSDDILTRIMGRGNLHR